MSETVEQLVSRFKALADPARLRLLALCAQTECSVSELAEVLAISQPRVSQQVRVLNEAGLLERFRDGQRVFYRIAASGPDAQACRKLLDLLPDSTIFEEDLRRLTEKRAPDHPPENNVADPGRRALHRALLELTVSSPLGELLDVGSGSGRVLKLLAGRVSRAIGVDIDSNARDQARNELLLAGLKNCSVRQGDMYRLPFTAGSFDTVILDDVLGNAERPEEVISEAGRVVRASGRLIVLSSFDSKQRVDHAAQLAAWCGNAGLRLSAPRPVPARDPEWLISVARPAGESSAVA